jgi:hypothetical protein
MGDYLPYVSPSRLAIPYHERSGLDGRCTVHENVK